MPLIKPENFYINLNKCKKGEHQQARKLFHVLKYVQKVLIVC
jgi:hypothetical protein